MGDVTGTVLGGSMLLAVPIAVLAGLVSFASPCVLPLVPGYLGYVTGMAGASRASGPADGTGGAPGAAGAVATAPPRLADVRRGRLLAGVGLFVAGFTLVFVLFGVLAGTLGAALAQWSDVVTRVLGVVVVLMGLAFLGWLPFGQRERRLHLAPRAGLWGAPLLGVVFGLGWAPCIGPTLVAVYTLALDGASAGRGAVLSVAYCVGLGLPFLLVALGLERSQRALGFLRRHRVVVMRVGGGVLVAVGLALVTGLWGVWTQSLQGLVGGFETVL
ncbi:cytochrome c biogenesis CcdA family protein [Actinotalea solisilvae]|uniref:cytochrome c biogenesis CcdA family protein n=1 Tax=Actinotalea solisilvae TaxID=2072922 RepID=UPI0018F1880B|nr:cytochrome c biogenesis CcdA family protein [Actinotalea solisilvae]